MGILNHELKYVNISFVAINQQNRV